MDIISELKKLIEKAVGGLGIEVGNFSVEYPENSERGDLATNVAMVSAKKAGMNPKELAEKIKIEIEKIKPDFVGSVEIAGPGFINFHLSPEYFTHELRKILKDGKKYGKGSARKRERIIIDYTDPNPFKEFHIGHLMSNAIGESLSRLVESQGAKVVRVCYQGDVGPHVAKTIYGIQNSKLNIEDFKGKSLSERTRFLGECYTSGSRVYEEDETAKKEIEEINRKIFTGDGKELMRIYELGKKWSLEHFDEIYRELGTKFDKFIFESEVADDGVKITQEFLKKGVFENSDGAVVFKGEKHDPKLHTRVFINSKGLPTYEAKELGLNALKWKKWRPDKSIIVTANEQSEYFRVVLKALEQIAPDIRKVTEHIAHGMLRLADGKMSSRKGSIITGKSLLRDVKGLVSEKIKDRGFDKKENEEIASIVAVAAIKYSILKQAIGGDIVYDFEKSVSFEGDSGPYLLYTAVRAKSVLEKAKDEGIKLKIMSGIEVTEIEKILSRFPQIVQGAENDNAPHKLASYLIELSATFNSWYAHTTIVVKGDKESPYRVAITEAVRTVPENGLDLLGIKVPNRM